MKTDKEKVETPVFKHLHRAIKNSEKTVKYRKQLMNKGQVAALQCYYLGT